MKIKYLSWIIFLITASFAISCGGGGGGSDADHNRIYKYKFKPSSKINLKPGMTFLVKELGGEGQVVFPEQGLRHGGTQELDIEFVTGKNYIFIINFKGLPFLRTLITKSQIALADDDHPLQIGAINSITTYLTGLIELHVNGNRLKSSLDAEGIEAYIIGFLHENFVMESNVFASLSYANLQNGTLRSRPVFHGRKNRINLLRLYFNSVYELTSIDEPQKAAMTELFNSIFAETDPDILVDKLSSPHLPHLNGTSDRGVALMNTLSNRKDNGISYFFTGNGVLGAEDLRTIYFEPQVAHQRRLIEIAIDTPDSIVKGRVNGLAKEGTRVLLLHQNKNRPLMIQEDTDSQGHFEFNGIPQGSYELRFRKPGYVFHKTKVQRKAIRDKSFEVNVEVDSQSLSDLVDGTTIQFTNNRLSVPDKGITSSKLFPDINISGIFSANLIENTPIKGGVGDFSEIHTQSFINMGILQSTPQQVMGNARIYSQNDGRLYFQNSNGNVYDLTLGARGIPDHSITNINIMHGSVDSVSIADDSITSTDIASQAITSSELAMGSILSHHIGQNSISSIHITDHSISGADLNQDLSLMGNLSVQFSANVSGNLFANRAVISNLIYPTVDGAPGQVLATDGAGNLSWVTRSTSGVSGNLDGISDLTVARSNLGLGSMATQEPSAVAITGGNISSVSSVGISGQSSGNAFTVQGNADINGHMNVELLSNSIVLITDNYSVNNHQVILADSSGKNIRITLPDPGLKKGIMYTVKKISAFNLVTLSSDSFDLEYAEANRLKISDQTSVNVMSTGTKWVFLSQISSGSEYSYRNIDYIKASNPGANDQFGRHLALSGDGNTLAISAIYEDSDSSGINGSQSIENTTDSGAIYVFVKSSANLWTQQAYIKSSNPDETDRFGRTLDLSYNGNTLAVGTYDEDSNAQGIGGNQSDNSASTSGAVYIFTRSGNSWSQQEYLKASNSEALDYFGFSVSLSDDGNTLAVGSQREDSQATGVNGNQADNTGSDSGAAYVFTRAGSIWSQQAYLKASNTDLYDRFGHVVSLSGDGNTLAVYAHQEDSNATGVGGDQSDNSLSNPGAVYVFIRTGSVWTQQEYLKAPNGQSSDQFGYNLSFSYDGNTLAISSFGDDSSAVGINGDQSDNSASNSGAVFVFVRSGSTWSSQAYIKASNTQVADHFATSLSLSGDGNILVVGARSEDSNAVRLDSDQNNNDNTDSGAAYLFKRSGQTWSQTHYIKGQHVDDLDGFGYDIDLSADGKTLSVGIYREDSQSSGLNQIESDNGLLNSGAVYLYYFPNP